MSNVHRKHIVLAGSLAVLLGAGATPALPEITRCSGSPCQTPDAAQAGALFDSIEARYPQYFPASSPTQALTIEQDTAYYRLYSTAISTGLAAYQGGLWYAVDGSWNRYSSLDEGNRLFCGGACWSSGDSAFTLKSEVGVEGGVLPSDYSCDGSGVSPPLSWANAPAGTKEFAMLMTTIPVDGNTKWNWVLYGIPATTVALARNSSGVGSAGAGSHGATLAYEPPCSQGPGAKLYTFTLYALSAAPALPALPGQVTGAVLTQAIAPITLGSASLNLTYTRP